MAGVTVCLKVKWVICGSTLLTESLLALDRVAVRGAADLVRGWVVRSGLIKAQLGFHILVEAGAITAGVLLVAVTNARRRPAVPIAS